jgi:antitoxin component YwqK of YwqJK toxin-antitoxin module
MNNETKTINLCDLPNVVIVNIVSKITNSVDYNNFRIINKKLYSLLNTIKRFDNNKCIQETYIENQYYINKHYFHNNKIKLLNKYIIDTNFDAHKTSFEREYYITGSLKRITSYKNGTKDGLEKVYFENNILRRQSFYKNDIKYSNEIINDIDGKTKYIIYYNYNYIYIKKYNKNMICYDISLKNNELHGVCKYYVYGSLNKSVKYNNGIMQGLYKLYNIMGLDKVVTYDNNKKNGVFFNYDHQKNIKLCGNYKNNRLHGTINFFICSKLIKSIEMTSGLLHGKYTEYVDLKKQFIFRNNKLNGYYTEDRYTNVLKLKIKFNENLFDNIYKTYDIYGYLDKEYVFSDGDYIVKKYWRNALLYSLYKINENYYIYYKNNKIKLL